MARNKDYEKLPGRGQGFASFHTLWLGPGHLLLVENSGYRESYVRVELADIQAFIVRRTNSVARKAVFGAMLLLLAAATFAAQGGLQVFWGILTGIVAVFLVIELSLGPTCHVHLRTPVQMLHLRSLRRWRLTRKVLARLRPMIEQAQGTLSPEQIRNGLDDIAPLPEVRPKVASTAARKRRGSTSPTLYTVLAALLLIDIPVTLAQGLSPASWLNLVGGLLFVAEIGVAIAAAVRQRNLGPSPALRVWLAITSGYLIVSVVVSVVYEFITNMAYVLEETTRTSGVNSAALVIAFGFGLLFAAWLVLELRRRRSERAT